MREGGPWPARGSCGKRLLVLLVIDGSAFLPGASKVIQMLGSEGNC